MARLRRYASLLGRLQLELDVESRNARSDPDHGIQVDHDGSARARVPASFVGIKRRPWPLMRMACRSKNDHP
jgi:hypothetical protein